MLASQKLEVSRELFATDLATDLVLEVDKKSEGTRNCFQVLFVQILHTQISSQALQEKVKQLS